jgi:non-ribosomal peptide synthetase component F
MHSLNHIGVSNEKDTVVQMARCSFDVHIEDIMGSLMIGATLVMLRPGGTLDFDYLSTVLEKKQITYMDTVPSLLHGFFIFVEEFDKRDAVKYMRSLISGGMWLLYEILSLYF